MIPPTTANPTPATHSKPRQNPQSPAASDHSIVPIVKITPMMMNTQGFASYRVLGVQERICRFYSAGRFPVRFVYNCVMKIREYLRRIGMISPWSVELALAAIALLIGAGLMPLLIFYAGVFTLGRYEGAGLGRIYHSLFVGLGQASIASWVVLLGPYGLYLLFKGLRLWWRASARLA